MGRVGIDHTGLAKRRAPAYHPTGEKVSWRCPPWEGATGSHVAIFFAPDSAMTESIRFRLVGFGSHQRFALTVFAKK